jgi:xanthine/CO dehydrogenase XdhC/CoxF family maturation factor
MREAAHFIPVFRVQGLETVGVFHDNSSAVGVGQAELSRLLPFQPSAVRLHPDPGRVIMRFWKPDRRMHLGTHALLNFYHAHRDEESLVLATIIATAGSTYRKPGAMMLISRRGEYAGLISGGCLEGDLLLHAERVFESGAPGLVTYDMHADEELVWNLGLGCDGVIHLLLQRLEPKPDFGLLGHLAASHKARRAVLLALVTQSDGQVPAGAWGLFDSSDISVGEPELVDILKRMAEHWPDWRCRPVRFGADNQAESIVIHIPAPTRVLICGAGPDAVPMARVLAELDWDVVITDHRPAFARAERFPAGCTVLQGRPEGLSEKFDLTTLDAAVIMSHHLENDRAYLGQLARYELPYIGVLGPRARRDRLRELAECRGRTVYGPIGLDIGAELPSAIALAAAAEIHAVLNGRTGASLT